MSVYESWQVSIYSLQTGHYEKQYKAGNSRAMWRAIKCCTEYKIPLPDWVSDYLANTANSFLEMDSLDKYFQSEVVRILGIKAKDFSDEHKLNRNIKIMSFIMLHEAPTLEDKFYAAEDEFGLSFSTIKNLYYKMMKLMRGTPDDLECDPDGVVEDSVVEDVFISKETGEVRIVPRTKKDSG